MHVSFQFQRALQLLVSDVDVPLVHIMRRHCQRIERIVNPIPRVPPKVPSPSRNVALVRWSGRLNGPDHSQAAAVVLGAFLKDVLRVDLRAARGEAADGGHDCGSRDRTQEEAVGGVAGLHVVVEDEERAPTDVAYVAFTSACSGNEGRVGAAADLVEEVREVQGFLMRCRCSDYSVQAAQENAQGVERQNSCRHGCLLLAN